MYVCVCNKHFRIPSTALQAVKSCTKTEKYMQQSHITYHTINFVQYSHKNIFFSLQLSDVLIKIEVIFQLKK